MERTEQELNELLKKNPKFRAYSFTINNWTQEDLEAIKQIKYRYIILGDEIGERGTPHIQGYICFTNPISFRSIYKKIKRAYIKPSYANSEANTTYCSKEKILFEDGEKPNQGKRTDIEEIREIVRETGKMSEVVLRATSHQSIKVAEQILKYHEPKRNWKPNVKWYYGKTGKGKSHTAYDELDNPYTCLNNGKWWDGYDAHENVIIDDFREKFCEFKDLLRILDKYPYTIEVKGGTRQFLAKTIIITAPSHPTEYYRYEDEDIQQLLRRIDEIREFK